MVTGRSLGNKEVSHIVAGPLVVLPLSNLLHCSDFLRLLERTQDSHVRACAHENNLGFWMDILFDVLNKLVVVLFRMFQMDRQL